MLKLSAWTANKDRWIQSAILLGFSALIIKLIWQGSIGYYINPKMLPWIVASAVLLPILASVLFIQSTQVASKIKTTTYLLFIVPLCMGMFVPAKTITAQEVQLSVSANAWQPTDTKNPLLKLEKFSQLVFTDQNFSSLLNELYMRMNEYEGTAIALVGKIYLDDSMRNNEFAIVRPIMTCCSADTTFTGFVCINKSETNVALDQWVKIEGKVFLQTIDGAPTPAIQVQKITPAEKPKNEIVYPY